MRLEAEGGGEGGGWSLAEGGDRAMTAATEGGRVDVVVAPPPPAPPMPDDDDDDSIDVDDPNEPVVACFGEIVEDPTLAVEEECHDPTVVRENVRKLNRAVLGGFLKLVHRLADEPGDNK